MQLHNNQKISSLRLTATTAASVAQFLVCFAAEYRTNDKENAFNQCEYNYDDIQRQCSLYTRVNLKKHLNLTVSYLQPAQLWAILQKSCGCVFVGHILVGNISNLIFE